VSEPIPTEEQLNQQSAIDCAMRISTGEMSSSALVESCIEQIDLINPVVNAMITRNDDEARTQALLADDAVRQGRVLGRLHGLPVAIKDIQVTRGIRTTFGSEDYWDNIPTVDAGIVNRIRRAGGIVLGKTNIPEYSIGANTVNRLFGATGNPFNPELTCGGSSGGSAVAVATGMAPLATGSDHGGSLRIPACYSGVVGYRATPGVVPNENRATFHTNYSVQGPMARSVADAALLLSVIAERDENARKDPMVFPFDADQFANLASCDVSQLRIAVTADLGGVLVSDTIRRSFFDRVNRIAGIVKVCDWHDVNLTSAPGVDWHVRQDLFVTQYHNHASTWDEGFNPNVRATYESALKTPMEDIASARRQQMELFQVFAAIFDEYDLVICPGVSIPPFPWSELNPQQIDGKPVENYMAWLALTASLTVVGHPVVALPCGLDEQGTPFGIQIVGGMYEDHHLLSAANALEQAFAAQAELSRPVPAFDALAKCESSCVTLGKQVTFEGTPGHFNAITDVKGVQVGYSTLIEGDHIRTGVTAILPRPVEMLHTPVFAGYFSLNGNGELSGTLWIEEAGRCEGPITITNTHSCGLSRDATIKWMLQKGTGTPEWALPVAGETYDGVLNDINGFHVKDEHVFAALNTASSGAIEEGSVGGGTGMICYGFKGGSGTASRVIETAGTTITIGAFVQANFGRPDQLTIAGVPVGRLLGRENEQEERGSIIGIIATDAPLLPHQLKRLARRVGLGIGRSGAVSGHGSGDIFLAFSTANESAHHDEGRLAAAEFVPNALLDSTFEAVIQAVDEAILNSLFANTTMTGINGTVIHALPHQQVNAILEEYNRSVT
jgi:Asp-tRNA(Asn)/Glu-tRNA(Gln) amidotransferase A subunit family amidase/L-aminopeptidase/D-esterase-like protein